MRYLLLLMVFFPMVCSAKMSEEKRNDISRWLDSLNTSANTTKGDLYVSQRASHLTGGSITLRNRVENTQPIVASVPSLPAKIITRFDIINLFSVAYRW